jgi:small subunit ribosomal protein S19e
MKSIFEVPANDLIKGAAKELSKLDQIKPPQWSLYVKTGVQKQRPPVSQDWWYVRAASILHTVHKIGPIGVSKLRTRYGGRKNRGVATDKVTKGSGKIIRLILQQLESAGLIKQADKGIHKGRIITPKGISFLSGVAKSVGVKLAVEQKVKKTEPKAEPKEHKIEESKPKKAEPKEPKAEEHKKKAPKAELAAEAVAEAEKAVTEEVVQSDAPEAKAVEKKPVKRAPRKKKEVETESVAVALESDVEKEAEQ